jgi:hypothetical protein
MFSQFVSSLQTNTVNMSAQAPGRVATSGSVGEAQHGSSVFGAVPAMHSTGAGGGGDHSVSAEHSGQSQRLLSPTGVAAPADGSSATAPQLYVRASDGTFVPVTPS